MWDRNNYWSAFRVEQVDIRSDMMQEPSGSAATLEDQKYAMMVLASVAQQQQQPVSMDDMDYYMAVADVFHSWVSRGNGTLVSEKVECLSYW